MARRFGGPTLNPRHGATQRNCCPTERHPGSPFGFLKTSPTASLGGDVLKTPAVASANKFALLFPNPSEPVYPSEIRTSAVTRNSATPSITLEAHFVGKKTGRLIGAAALLDSGAEGIIVNQKFAKKNNFTLRLLPRPIPVRNVDGSTNVSGAVRFATVQQCQDWCLQ